MTKSVKALLALLRLALGEGRGDSGWPPEGLSQARWEQLFALSARQGTVLLAYGGIQHLPPLHQPPRRLKLRWVANVVKGNERWGHYRQTVADLSHMLSGEGFDVLVLKGLTISSLYPVPWYREGGDVDIWLFGEADRADKIISSMGIGVQHPTAKHSAFAFRGVTVENHRMFFDTASLFGRERALYKKMERMLTQMFTLYDCPGTGVGSTRELPPAAAALFLLGHTFRHFCCNDINVRHLCDWVVFFEKHKNGMDGAELARRIEELHLGRFVAAINSFCRAHLGFEPPFFAAADAAGPATPATPADRKMERKSRKLITKMITRYRVVPRVHIPVVGVLRHIFLRNRIYNEYLARTAPSEFLLPELGRYFAWLAKRFRHPKATKSPVTPKQ